MSKESYAGLDYSGPGSTVNRDSETGIRYGVISMNSVMPEAWDDVEYDYGTPQEAFKCPNCHEKTMAHKWGDDVKCDTCGEEFETEMPDYIEPCGWSYEGDGYAITSCLDNDAMIIKSPFYTYAQFCSPCVPGAGNLDNPFPINPALEPKLKAGRILYRRGAEKAGFPKVYCLGPDWFDQFAPCPYPVIFRVDGKEMG